MIYHVTARYEHTNVSYDNLFYSKDLATGTEVEMEDVDDDEEEEEEEEKEGDEAEKWEKE